MKKLAWVLLLPLVVLAASRDDYASQWPLALQDADGGAYRVVLDREVYRQLQSPRLQDLVVVNAQGTPVATAVFPADAPLAQAGASIAVPWFPLPVSYTHLDVYKRQGWACASSDACRSSQARACSSPRRWPSSSESPQPVSRRPWMPRRRLPTRRSWAHC